MVVAVAEGLPALAWRAAGRHNRTVQVPARLGGVGDTVVKQSEVTRPAWRLACRVRASVSKTK